MSSQPVDRTLSSLDSDSESDTTRVNPVGSTFHTALKKYLDGIPSAKQQRDFIAACYDPDRPVSSESVLNHLQRLKHKSSNANKSKVSRIIEKVVGALKDYDGVINTLVSADPMPSALIWGGLSIIINAAHRHYGLISRIQTCLQDMGNIVMRLTRCELLCVECPILQTLLCESYICIFEILSRIYEEISKSNLKAVVFTATSHCLRKLEEIIIRLGQKERDIGYQLQILQAEFSRKDSDYQKDWRLNELRSALSTWLCRQAVTAACHKRYEELQRGQLPSTCSWVDQHPQLSTWLDSNRVPDSRVLPLYAPPGCGKSTLCAHSIRAVLERDPSSAVAYHFCRFYERFDASDILRHLASQLFHKYLSSHSYSNTMLKRLKEIIDDENISLRARAEKFTEVLIKLFPVVYIFIDGLDEEAQRERWKEASLVLEFLLGLARAAPNVRIWSSSQNIDCVQRAFKGYDLVNVGSEVKQDVALFLSVKANDLDLSDESRSLLMGRSGADRSGCFLWANVMIQELENANSPADKERIILEGPTLDEYYTRFFRCVVKNDRSATHKIFALVAYARRPLRIRELQEAVAILSSWNQPHGQVVMNLQENQLLHVSSIKRLCAPLIVFESEEGDSGGEVCHLYHSALLRFLERNPDVLENKEETEGFLINSQVIANACVGYLSQERYSSLLQKQVSADGTTVQWTDVDGKSVHCQYFLSYAAKYWDKHFDIGRTLVCSAALPTIDQDKQLLSEKTVEMVKLFLESDNFRTCLQVQSLFVDGQFSLYRTSMTHSSMVFLRRVFPDWLGFFHGFKYSMGYQEYCAEWMFLLDPSSSTLNLSALVPYSGEIDRCWWRALATPNFLSRFDGKYASFRLESTGERDPLEGAVQCTNVTNEGTRVETLSLSIGETVARVQLHRWTLSSGRFELMASEVHSIGRNRLKLEQYTSCGNCFSTRKDRSKLVEFNVDGNVFRIGAQLFANNGRDVYTRIDIPDLKYVEEIGAQGNIVATATRRRHLKGDNAKALDSQPQSCCQPTSDKPESPQDDLNDVENFTLGDFDIPGSGTTEKSEDRAEPARSSRASRSDSSEDSSDSSDEEVSDDTSSGDETDDDAYESWSECSSDNGGSELESEGSFGGMGENEGTDVHRLFEQEFEPSAVSDSEDNESDVSNPLNLKCRSETTDSDDELRAPETGCSDSDSDNSEIARKHLGGCQIKFYGEDILSSDEEDAYMECVRAARQKRARRKNAPLLARLRIYNVESPTMPKEMFSYSTDLQLPLYNSPPVIHPSHHLVVWPLGGGKILFGDFEINSFFTRKLKPSTSSTRHVFMKCRFSACGAFLHVAALEGQLDTASQTKSECQTMSLAIVAYTFRLCSSQPTRTPPTFIHKARLNMGHYKGIFVNDIPFELTWRPSTLYVTERSTTLKVYRVNLFPKNPEEDVFPIFRPGKQIILPGTSLERDVRFFPSSQGHPHAWVILGPRSTNPGKFPAVGCFLDEVKDLDGWIRSSGIQDVPNPQGNGHLIQPLERFNPDEDCDLEPFLFLG